MAKRDNVGLIGPAAQWELLFASKPEFADPTTRPKHEWVEILDNIGEERVLEIVASGRLPVEIALSNRIPTMIFYEWFEANVDAGRLKLAQRAHAEMSVLKSQLALAATPETPADAAVQKELSTRYAWMAERMHAEKWGPPQKKDAAPPSVSIVMNIGKRGEITLSEANEKVIEHQPNANGAQLGLSWGGSVAVGSNADVEKDPPLPAGLAPRPTLEERLASRRPYAEGEAA